MVKMLPPKYAYLDPQLVKSYSPQAEKVSCWHIVKHGLSDTLDGIAERYRVPSETLIEFNFPGSVTNGRIDPHVVNWYLFNLNRTRCRRATHDGHNYVLTGGEKIAIPFLGSVVLGEPVILTPTNTRFKIRQVLDVSVSKALTAEGAYFQIWDEQAGLASLYVFEGVGYSYSGIPIPISVTLSGPWNEFRVTKSISVNQFEGKTRFSSQGAGSVTDNRLDFMALPSGTQTIPASLPLNTGFTFGAGWGTSFGIMTLLKYDPDGLRQFKGE
jgi:hypothetical protein